MKRKIPSKYQVLNHFVKTADTNCICMYYTDPYFQSIPSCVREKYIKELSAEGYLKPRIRHVILTADAYTFKNDQRVRIFTKFLSVLGRPVSYFISWVLGICSALLVEYLIKVLFS